MKLGMCGFTIGAAAYFKQFPVVEVQQTFYDPPDRGFEREIRKRLDYWAKLRRERERE